MEHMENVNPLIAIGDEIERDGFDFQLDGGFSKARGVTASCFLDQVAHMETQKVNSDADLMLHFSIVDKKGSTVEK